MRVRTIRELAIACALVVTTSAVAAVKLKPALRLRVEERYDDDLLARAGPTSGSQLMTKVAPEADLSLEGRTFTSKASYATDLVVRHGSGNMSLDHRGELELHKQLSRRSRIELTLRAWRVSDPSSLPRLGMARTLSPVLYGRGDLSGSLRLSARWTGKLGYRFEGVRIFDERASLGLVHAPFVEAWHATTRRLELGLGYRLQRFVFEGEPAGSHAAFVLGRYRLSRLMTLTFRGGPVQFEDPGGGGLLPAIDVGLEYRWERLQLALAAGHDLAGASGLSAALWADYGSVVMTWRPLARLELMAAASYFRNGPAPAVGFNPFGEGAPAVGYALGGGAEWRLSRSISARLSLERVAQFGGAGGGPPPLARNIVSARVLVTAF